jgi:PEP-CTERM motif-containing protein
MARAMKISAFVLAFFAPVIALGDAFPILAFTPAEDGKLNDEPSSNINSIAVFDGSAFGQVHSPLALQGAVAAEVTGNVNRAWILDHPNILPGIADMLIGLDAGTAVLGLGSDGNSAVAAWFANPVTGDGNSLTSEIFLVDWGKSLDNFQVQLLTSDAAAGIAGAVIAKTVQVTTFEQIQTTTELDTVQGGDDQLLAGVGIDLDSESLGAIEILGVLVPAADGLGGLSGFDPAIIAALGPEPTPGDFDYDGDVDGKDFLTWQRGSGILAGAAYTDGDANLDGAVDGADLLLWQDGFGPDALAVVSTVPEPGTLLLVAVGAIAGLLRRRDGNC